MYLGKKEKNKQTNKTGKEQEKNRKYQEPRFLNEIKIDSQK